MAELNVERVPRRSAGPWLLGILALAVLAWAVNFNTNEDANPVIATGSPAGLAPVGGSTNDVPLVRGGDADPAGTVPLVPAASVRGAPAAVNAYLGAITRHRAAASPGAPEVVGALRRLADAMVAAAGTQARVVGPAADSLRRLAGALQGENDAARQPAIVRDAFVLATGALRELQERRAPAAGGVADALAHAAEAVDPRRPLDGQGRAVQRWLDTAGAVLEQVVRRA